ncbi:MAG: hypothetical protein AAF485_08555 [Chloroflexota bacterium]
MRIAIFGYIKDHPESKYVLSALFCLILGFWLIQTKTIHESWNESSRLASIQSLVEHGTWRIDASPYGHQTGDKMLLNGHYYSEKPPLFAAIGAVFYALLHYGMGATLAIDGCQAGTLCVYYWLTIFIVGAPSAVMVILFYRLAIRQSHSFGWAIALTILLCLGTIVWPYSLVFNHHLPAAIALFVSYYFLLPEAQSPGYIFFTGILAGTAVMLDLTALFLATALFLIVLLSHRQGLFLFILGGIIPGLLTVIFNYQITGGPLFAYFSPEGYNFPGSPWGDTVGGQNPPDNVLYYTFRSLIGDRGLFGYSPLMLFAVGGLFYSLRTDTVRLKFIAIALGLVAHLLFVFTRTNHFGGDAYGWRFLIPIIPVLYSFIIFTIPKWFSQRLGMWLVPVWGIAILLSIVSAYQGVLATWHTVTPPFYLAWYAKFPYVGAETNFQMPEPDSSRIVQQSPPKRFDIPEIDHRLDIQIDQNLMLLGYDLPSRYSGPGQDLSVTVYWQLIHALPNDYFVFTNLLDSDQTQVAGLDRRLQEGYPIAFWYPGEVVVDQRKIPIPDDAPDGVVELRLGLYEISSIQSSIPLPLFKDGTLLNSTDLGLQSILLGQSPTTVDVADINPQYVLETSFGEPPVISLIGYDLEYTEEQLRIIRYWKSIAPTQIDYTAFVHGYTPEGDLSAQFDNPPTMAQYPTSLWQPGEVIVDVITLANQDNLLQELRVGLYDPATGERLSLPEQPDNSVYIPLQNFP